MGGGCQRPLSVFLFRRWRAAEIAAPTKAVQKLATSDNKFKVRFYESAKSFPESICIKNKAW